MELVSIPLELKKLITIFFTNIYFEYLLRVRDHNKIRGIGNHDYFSMFLSLFYIRYKYGS